MGVRKGTAVTSRAANTNTRTSSASTTAPSAANGPGNCRGLIPRWKIVGVLLLASLLPLAVVGVGASVVFRNLLLAKTLELQRGSVENRASAIDLYLTERLRALELAW